MVAREGEFYTIDASRFTLQADIPSLSNPSINYPNNNITTLQKPNNNPSCGTGSLCTTANSTRLYRLKSSEVKTGLGITLKVMAGDKIDVAGKSYYFESGSIPPSSNNLPILNIIAGFLGGPTGAGVTSVHGAITPALINPGTSNQNVVNFFNEQNNQTTTSNKPRAFINVIFFDEQFKVVDYRVSIVGGNGILYDQHYNDLKDIAVTKSGFAYIYCSNESDINVYFDNLQVVQTRSPILEETHYYPFGLTMSGISSKAAGSLENKYKYSGIELNSDFDINLYESFYRSYDPQIGRFWQIDPKAELDYSWSPYVANYDNPISFNDPKGDTPPTDEKTNTVNSVNKNKDGSYTIKETLNIRKTTSSEKINVKQGGKNYTYTKTTQQLSSTETTTTIDAKGKIVSSNSTTYNGVGTYYSDVYQENGNGTLSPAGTVNAEQGDNWGFPQTKGSMAGPLAITAQRSMSSSLTHSFPLFDDAEVYINTEFGDNSLALVRGTRNNKN